MSRGPESPTIKLPHFPTIYPPSTPKKSLFLLPCSSLVLFSRSKMPSTLPAASGTWQAGVWDSSTLLWSKTLTQRDTHSKPSTTCCHSKHRKGDTEVSPNICWLWWLEIVPPSASAFPPNPRTSQPQVYRFLLRNCWFQGCAANRMKELMQPWKQILPLKYWSFFTGDYIKNWHSLIHFSLAAGPSCWSGGRWKYHLSIKWI